MALPTGPAVAFLFTDIEGSTRSERSVGAAAWAALVARHDALLREAIESHGGVVVKTEGDAFFAAFQDPIAAALAAVAAQRLVAAEPWPSKVAVSVRMGVHLGAGVLRAARPGEAEDYVGIDVNYAARIAAAGNGGQIVLTEALVAALPRGLDRLPNLSDVWLLDDGLRIVKDFEEPARLYRLVVPGAADDERPLRTMDVPSNLPGDVTTLVGREAEIETVRGLLDISRVVTLAGPGGSGKTRLALGVAQVVRRQFPHGVWFIDLATVQDATMLESTIAATLAVRESPTSAISEMLAAYLRDRNVLLVLDNLEQLLPGVAQIVARIVRAARNLRVLVTSRELLRISGEQGHSVPPLALDSAVALFVDRARSHRPDFVAAGEILNVVRAICERLGGLPLAIELAAARIRMLPPAMILDRLGRSLDLSSGNRDLPERQRTLRGAIAWSFDLLSDAERSLFARLGVFAGGGTIEAAIAVADPAGDLGIDLLSGLESLADKSFIRIDTGQEPPTASVAGQPVAGQLADGAGSRTVGSADPVEPRFVLHPLLREFALECLDTTGERSLVESRFADVYVGLAEGIGHQILNVGGEANLNRLDREDRNLRAAIDWSLSGNRPDIGLRIVGSVWRWYQQRGRLREARGLLAQLLADEAPVDRRIRIDGLAAEGGLAYWMNEFPDATAAYEERLALALATGDSTLMADAHYDVGFLYMVGQDAARLREHEQRALDLYLAVGREDGAVRARQALVLAVFLEGDYAAAQALEEQNLAVFRRTGSQFQIADSMTLLAAVHWRLGDGAAARRRVNESLAFFADIDSASGLARALGMEAIIRLSDPADLAEAEFGARITGATYRLVREHGVMLAPVTVLHLPDPLDLARERFGEARTAELMAEGELMAMDELVAGLLGRT